MLILVEGADGSGKTTLVNQLNKYFPTMRINRGNNHIKELYDNLTCMNEDIVLDRSFITDVVYRLALDDGIGTDGINMFYMDCILRDSIVIYCKTVTQFDDAKSRGEENITDLKTAQKISRYYDAVMKFINTRTSTRTIKYDWHLDTVEELVSTIKDIINKTRRK